MNSQLGCVRGACQLSTARAPNAVTDTRCLLFRAVTLAVQCNSFGNVGSDGTTCLENNGASGGTIRGITHMRLTCNDANFWILTYVVPGTLLQSNTGDMWIDTNCGGSVAGAPSVCKGASQSFSWGTTLGACGSTCSSNLAQRSDICCLNMWPVIDNVTRGGVQVEEQVGYIAKGYITSSNPVAWDTIIVHWDWEVVDASGSQTGGGTGSTAAKVGTGGNGICFNCAGEGQTAIVASSLHGQLL